MVARPEKRVLLGARLRELREDAGLSQGVLAAIAGISQPALSNYEADRRELPLEAALDIVAALSISLGDLLSGSERVIVVRGGALAAAVLVLQSRPDLAEGLTLGVTSVGAAERPPRE